MTNCCKQTEVEGSGSPPVEVSDTRHGPAKRFGFALVNFVHNSRLLAEGLLREAAACCEREAALFPKWPWPQSDVRFIGLEKF